MLDERGAEELGGVSGRSLVECIVRDRSGASDMSRKIGAADVRLMRNQ